MKEELLQKIYDIKGEIIRRKQSLMRWAGGGPND